MNKFEYRVVILSPLYHFSEDIVFRNHDIEYLNILGDEGWEVCAVDGNKYLLKRKYINMENAVICKAPEFDANIVIGYEHNIGECLYDKDFLINAFNMYYVVEDDYLNIDKDSFPEVTFKNSPQQVEIKLVKEE